MNSLEPWLSIPRTAAKVGCPTLAAFLFLRLGWDARHSTNQIAKYLYQFPTSGRRLNSRKKFFVVAAAISCSSTASKLARVRAVRLTQAGSLRLPRLGTGASQGASGPNRGKGNEPAWGSLE